MSKVFITGIDGFTGQYLATKLAKDGHLVCGLTRSESADLAWPTTACDLLDLDGLSRIIATEKPDVVVHLAAIAFVAHGDVGEVYKTNIVGTRNLFEAVARASYSPSSILLASSANVYGSASDGVISESVTPAPANDYAVSKIASEYVAKLWMDRLPVTIVRPFNYTGLGQSPKFLLPKIVAHFRDRAPVLELGNLNVIRDFSDVRDVIDTYARLIMGNFTGETFNVCSGDGYSLEQVLELAREITGHRPEIVVNPNFVRANEVYKLIGDKTKLTHAIGPRQAIPLRETLKWMLDY